VGGLRIRDHLLTSTMENNKTQNKSHTIKHAAKQWKKNLLSFAHSIGIKTRQKVEFGQRVINVSPEPSRYKDPFKTSKKYKGKETTH